LSWFATRFRDRLGRSAGRPPCHFSISDDFSHLISFFAVCKGGRRADLKQTASERAARSRFDAAILRLDRKTKSLHEYRDQTQELEKGGASSTRPTGLLAKLAFAVARPSLPTIPDFRKSCVRCRHPTQRAFSERRLGRAYFDARE